MSVAGAVAIRVVAMLVLLLVNGVVLIYMLRKVLGTAAHPHRPEPRGPVRACCRRRPTS